MASSAKINHPLSSFSLFDEKAQMLFRGVREWKILTEDSKDITDQQNSYANKKTIIEPNDCAAPEKIGLSCLVCQIAQFDSLEVQRDHFKLDWHRYNVKQKLMDKDTVTEQEFEQTISGELSSISGSDTSESEPEEDDEFSLKSSAHSFQPSVEESIQSSQVQRKERQLPKVYLINENNTVFSLFRTVFYSSKCLPEDDEEFVTKTLKCLHENVWVVLMTAGGHFAGAVFEGETVVAHKTFHRYTVRAKRGTAQGLRDSHQGSQPKSAGATLRRYNEAALIQEVQELLTTWSDHLLKCHKIFIRVPTYNQQMFFGGKQTLLCKSDPRIRTIPFATRRPTYKEVKRVHEQLTRIHILGEESDSLLHDTLQTTPRSSQKNKKDLQEFGRASATLDNNRPIVNDTEQSISPIKETNKKSKKKVVNRKDGQETTIQNIPFGETKPDLPKLHIWNRLYCAIMSGNRNIMEQLLSKSDPPFLKDSQSENKAIRLSDNSDQHRADDLNSCAKDQEALVTLPMAEHSASDNLTPASNPSNAPSDGSTAALEVLNERWGQGSSTLLHAAACSKHGDIVYALLRIGADPTVRDERGRTPYDAANRKEARNEFRRFMADHPDMHDYTLTHIPSPLTQVQLKEKEKKEAEKRKAQKKAKKQRAKEKKAIDQLKMEEEKKQERLSKLSDREKRARAAEQRFARQQVNSTEVGKISDAQRCAFCSRDLSGRVPFERLSFKYCNTTCVREHRLLLENR